MKLAIDGRTEDPSGCEKMLSALAEASCRGDMNDVSILLARLAIGLPFAYAHFNEGEVRAATQTKGSVLSGLQRYSPELKSQMRWAIGKTHPHLYVGLPCRAEFPRDYLSALTLVSGGRDRRTAATLFMNGNYRAVRELVPTLLRWRTAGGPGRTGSLHLVVGLKANITRFEEHTQLSPKQVLRAPAANSFSAYSTLKTAYQSFQGGDVVILCCGVLGRLLAADWVTRRPNTTFLELGSFFTPAFGDVKLQAYHRDHRWRPGCATYKDESIDRNVFAPMRRCLQAHYMYAPRGVQAMETDGLKVM